MATYIVSASDRLRARLITADSPTEAMQAFAGKRLAGLRLEQWTDNREEFFFVVDVKVGPGPYRLGRDAVAPIQGRVRLANP